MKCWFHVNRRISPPQVQGKRDRVMIKIPTYKVKSAISASDPYKPHMRVFGRMSNTEMNTSIAGNVMDKLAAKRRITGKRLSS